MESVRQNFQSPAAGPARASSWEIDYALPAFAAVIGVCFLPVLTTLRGLNVLDTPQYVVASLVLTIAVATVALLRWSLGGGAAKSVSQGYFGLSLIALVLVGFGSCLYAQMNTRGVYAIDMWQQYAMATSLMILFPVYAYLSQTRTLLKPILIGWDILAFFAIGTVLAHMLGLASGEAYGSRQFGLLGDAVAWLFSALVVVNFERRNWPLFLACAVFLVLTESRVPALIAGAGILLASIMQPNASLESMLKRCAVGALLIVSLFLIPVLMPALVERFQETDFLYNDRVETIRFSLDVFRDSPWIGSGYNAHSFYYAEHIGGRTGTFMILNTAVSTPIQILTDFGVAGFILFCLSALLLLIASFRLVRALPTGVPNGAPLKFFQLARGLACWMIPFVLFNQSAAYILPLSLLAVVFFAAAGIIISADMQLRTAARRQAVRL